MFPNISIQEGQERHGLEADQGNEDEIMEGETGMIIMMGMFFVFILVLAWIMTR